MSTRDEINEEIRSQLQTVTGRNVGLAEIPRYDPDPEHPPEGWPGESYIILYPQNTSGGEGGFGDGESDRDFLFQVTCVGRDPRQCAWVSSKVETFFTALKPGGGYLHDIPLVGHSVAWRLTDSLGAILPAGNVGFQSADQYRLRICRDT